MSIRIVLTHELTNRHDEFQMDREALTRVFDRAMSNFQNSMTSIQKTERLFWRDIVELYNLDEDKVYRVKWDVKERRAVLTMKEEDNE